MLKIWLPNRPVEEAMQKSYFWNAKKQASRCIEATIKMQSCNFWSAK